MEQIYKIPRNEKLLKNLMWCNVPACSRSLLILMSVFALRKDREEGGMENETCFIVLQYIL